MARAGQAWLLRSGFDHRRATGLRGVVLLYLVRHADAVDATPDSARELSRKGHEQMKTLGKFFRGNGCLEPQEIWHSPYQRAVETAQLLCEGLGLKLPMTVVPEVTPDDEPKAVLSRLRKARVESLAIVGHEPHLSGLASLLVTGKAVPARFLFKKTTVLALEGEDDFWLVRWMASPELLR